MKNFKGKVLFLNKKDINTDEIIPAKYLTEIKKQALKPYLLEDLVLDKFDPATDIKGKSVIITRNNFGCGSSREHAPWALEVNGFNLVIASGFARIFRQNMFNCGMMAVQIGEKKIDYIFSKYAGRDTRIETDLENRLFTISADNLSEKLPFDISEFDLALVKAGGWVNYADNNY